jgi:predicted metal-dependent phosphotriesterase family hydrolase
MMVRRGISRQAIQTIMTDNPARLLDVEGK